MFYVAATVACGIIVPRVESAYLPLHEGIAVASAQAFLSATASGMLALTGIIFALAFVMVQFSAIAYSPRLVDSFASDRVLFHSLGVFVATFIYSLITLLWVDRGASGKVPLLSALIVALLCVLSMFFFSLMIQRLKDLQIANVLEMVGGKGRGVIEQMFPRLGTIVAPVIEIEAVDFEPGPITQSLSYRGPPVTVTHFDIAGLVAEAQDADALIEMLCAVGDTVVEGMPLLHVHSATTHLRDEKLVSLIGFDRTRTFEQDPSFAIRLLVDIAVKALSPAINDPTTAVQAIAEIEDLLVRLGHRALDMSYHHDRAGRMRLFIPMPSWSDYLALAFEEIRDYGGASVQVMRRLRSALVQLAESVRLEDRKEAVRRHIRHLDATVERYFSDPDERETARREDRQGLGRPRRQATLGGG
jgi:uncharacterized membrane protein